MSRKDLTHDEWKEEWGEKRAPPDEFNEHGRCESNSSLGSLFTCLDLSSVCARSVCVWGGASDAFDEHGS